MARVRRPFARSAEEVDPGEIAPYPPLPEEERKKPPEEVLEAAVRTIAERLGLQKAQIDEAFQTARQVVPGGRG